jgi:hypothetical protein
MLKAIRLHGVTVDRARLEVAAMADAVAAIVSVARA